MKKALIILGIGWLVAGLLSACSPSISHEPELTDDELFDVQAGESFSNDLKGSMKNLLQAYTGGEEVLGMVFCTTDYDETQKIEISSCTRVPLEPK